MGVFRSLLLAGLCSAAWAAGDASILVQREVGVHAAPGAVGAPPSKILERMEPSARGEMLRVMEAFTDEMVHFLRTVEVPLSNLLGEPVHQYKAWAPAQMAEFSEAFVVACNDSEFQAFLDRTAVEVSNRCGELGARMGALSAQLADNEKAASKLEDKKNLLQLSVQQSGEAMAKASGEVFNSLSYLLKRMPTEYLQKVTSGFKAMAAKHTTSKLSDFNQFSLQPTIKRSFEQTDICKPMQAIVKSFGELADWRSGTAASISQLNTTVFSLQPYLAEIDATLVAKVMERTSSVIVKLGDSLNLMGIGFEMYHKALSEVVKSKLSCDLMQ